MIDAQNICKDFLSKEGKKVSVLRDVNFHIKQGEFVAIVGPSGCGKSTLIKLLIGLIRPDSGKILIHSKSINISNGCIGYMSQADSLLPWRTVVRNVELGLEMKGIRSEKRKKVVYALIEKMGLKGFEKSYPFELSGGMKQRVSIIRTLAYDPEIIYMDEPFGALDVQTRDMLEDDILTIWEETKKTIIFVTHDLSEAIILADRIFLMNARPAKIKSEYIIDLPRPRHPDIRLTHGFNEILRVIWGDLSDEVRKSRDTIL
ncbi:MAG: ABC transporter ATP-binding protein [Thermodesulfobacteriota bacterium]|nr:ABC transporter ATP-binding protein [Thermodesulfobacteriota bacterium]